MDNTIDDYDRCLTATFEDVRQKADGRPTLTPGRALEIGDGIKRRDPARAAVMRKRRGTYPYPIHRQGRREYVLTFEVALTLVGPRPKPTPAATTQPESGKRGPGRPRKVRQAEDVSAAGGAT